MTLYAGQSNNSVTPLENEVGLLFDEATRRKANKALSDKSIDPDTLQKLERMYQDGSHQAGYFLGALIINEIIPYPLNQPRGAAGPGFDSVQLGPHINSTKNDQPINQEDYSI